MTAIAIGERNSPPAPNANALGAMPAAMAIVVIRSVGRASAGIDDRGRAVNAGVHRLDREVDQHDRVLGHDAHQHQDADDHRES